MSSVENIYCKRTIGIVFSEIVLRLCTGFIGISREGKQEIPHTHCNEVTPLGFRKWTQDSLYNEYTPHQVFFVWWVYHTFREPGSLEGYTIAAIGTCHNIIIPLRTFVWCMLGIDPEITFNVHLTSEGSNDVEIYGIRPLKNTLTSFTRHILPCNIYNGHSAVCFRIDSEFYVCDIFIGYIYPLKLKDYLSIISAKEQKITVVIQSPFGNIYEKVHNVIPMKEDCIYSAFSYK
jgi:hypothetical protein